MIGTKRSGATDEYSARKSLYALTQASISSPSPIVSILPAPNPATFGYSTAAQIPYLSIRLSRAVASHVAGSTSLRRGGCCGGYCAPAGLGGGRGGADALVPEVPGILLEALVELDVRDLVAPLLDVEARRPQVVRLDDVGVGVDDLVAVDL